MYSIETAQSALVGSDKVAMIYLYELRRSYFHLVLNKFWNLLVE